MDLGNGLNRTRAFTIVDNYLIIVL
jgi:hypothetical protein